VAFELEGRGLSPLSELLELADFPLAEFLPEDALASVFEQLSYTDAAVYDDGDNLVLDLQLVFEQELALRVPGSDAVALVFGSAGPGFTSLRTEIVLGPDFSLGLREAPLSLRVSPSILRDVASDGPAEITVTGDIRFTSSGIAVGNVSGASLPPAYLCGTRIVVEAENVVPVFGSIEVPEFLVEQEDFQGLALERLRVSLPAEYLETDPGADLVIELARAAIGTTGFTGAVHVAAADVAHPVTGRVLGFPFRFREFHLDLQQNALIDARLGADLRLEKFESGEAEKWVGVDLAFSADGGFTGALSALQPPEAEGTPEALVVVEFESVARLAIGALRVTAAEGLFAIYLSGDLKLLVEGAADWPEVGFDEIGLRSDGEILLPEGGGIALASPLVVSWHFARLTVSKLRFGHAEGSHTRLQLALSAEIALLEGLPAGASVEGLVIEWEPGSSAAPAVRFTGIGIEFGVPGSFVARLAVGYENGPEGVQFRGRGALELTALDMAIDVAVIVGEQAATPTAPAFVYLYLFADAKLLPSGIPIAATGLSIYGFQGLLAYNMALDLNPGLSADERYYELFTRAPIGITEADKWAPRHGQNALGVGLVVGTNDKGFAVNAKGMLVVAFPDLTILLQARANFLKKKPDLGTAQEGTLDALLVYAASDRALTLDITAHWGMPSLVSVDGQARAYFEFDDAGAWYLEIGRDEDGKRVVAKALQWNGEWLFSAGFWFRLDRQGLVTGILIEVSLKKRRGGFWVEATGSARGEMALFWEPAQWEGSLALAGRISAGYRGLSVGLSLSGLARARVRRPFDVHVHVEACVEALFWEVCKSFDFDWTSEDAPELEVPFRRAAAKPRHWTVYREPGPPESIDTGVVALWPEGGVPTIHPHSVICLDFAKPMVDATGAFNEAVALADGGFMTVGEGSGWAAAYRLDAVTLTRDPDGAAQAVPVWGTWARETLEPNTTLRLQTSHRFDDDGSLTGGYLEGTDLDYCAEPTPTRTCVSLEGIQQGHGWLADGSLYAWQELLQIRLRSRHDVVEIVLECPGREGAQTERVRREVKTKGEGNLVVLSPRDLGKCRPVELCYPRGHGRWNWLELSGRGGLATGLEEWTVATGTLVLPSQHLLELRLLYTALLKHPDGTVTEALGPGAAITKRFHVGGPPSRRDALDAYIAAVNPFDGARPVYTGYDLSVRFVDDYVAPLYRAVGEQLVIRLFDGQGRPVLDAEGHELLVPVVVAGPPEFTLGTLVWAEIVEANQARGCAGAPGAPPASVENGLSLPVSALGIALTPNSQYTAWLVSDARIEVPLHAWGFTTSSFATFTALVTAGSSIHPPHPVSGAFAGDDFESLARSAGLPTVRYADRFTVTPLADATGVLALLLEAPEPLGFPDRLAVSVAGGPAVAHASTDGTRAFVRPPGGAWPPGALAVTLRWLRDAGGAEPVLAVNGNTSPEIVAFEVPAGGAP
jgi:hypothetical protein